MTDLAPVFDALSAVMRANAVGMEICKDLPGDLQFNAPWPNPSKPKERMWFGGVGLRKAFVSYHLMPVYSDAELAASIPDTLRKRMQGKSCLNFKAVDESLFADLADLTRRSANAYASPQKVC